MSTSKSSNEHGDYIDLIALYDQSITELIVEFPLEFEKMTNQKKVKRGEYRRLLTMKSSFKILLKATITLFPDIPPLE